MASVLWADVDESVARARLRRLVYRLETTAGADLIVAKGDNLELRPGRLEVDSLEFARLAQHVLGTRPPAASVDFETLQAWVELASQPLLQDLDSLSEAFESWRRARRIDHDQLLVRLLRYMVQWQGHSGDAAAALGTAEKLIRLDPYSEPAYVLMMQLHAAQRSVSGVEGTYMRCADALRAEFGIRPSPTTDQAYLALLETAKVTSGPAALGEEVPSLRFATSARSTVAYATLGQGPRVLVVMPSFRSYIVWETWLDKLLKDWGGTSGIEEWAPSVAADPRVRAWWSRMVRQSVSPASLRVVVEGLRDTDVRPLLGRIKAPTIVMHRKGDRACRYGGGVFIAQHIPNAKLVPLEGEDHWWWQGDLDAVLRLVLDFAGGDQPQVGSVS